MTKDKALQMAINALTNCSNFEKAINACKEALEQPAQEPVAWYWDNHHRDKIPCVGVERGNPKMDAIFGTPIPLYTHPHQWQGLTDDELSHLKYLHVDYELFDEGEYGTECNVYVDDFAKAIEQALKENNT